MTDSAPSCDRVIVRRCVDGEMRAWRQLHRRYYPRAAAFLRRMGVADEDIEDACQEVFLLVFRTLPRFRGDSELQTWLYRICMTEARRLRRRRAVARTLSQLLRLQPRQPYGGLEMSESSARDKLLRALSALPDRERVVFVLFELDGLSGKQIAAIRACPEATVWRLLHQARRRFRAALGCDDAGSHG